MKPFFRKAYLPAAVHREINPVVFPASVYPHVKKQAIRLFTTPPPKTGSFVLYKSPTSHSPNSSAKLAYEIFYIIFQIPPLTHLQHHMENTLHNLHLPSKH